MTHSVDGGLQRIFHDPLQDFRRGNWGGSIRAHSASVRTLVSITDTLVVLSSGEGDNRISIRECQYRYFRSRHELFDDDFVAYRYG